MRECVELSWRQHMGRQGAYGSLMVVGRKQEHAADRLKPLYDTVIGDSCLLLISVHEGDYIPKSLHDAEGRPLGIADPADLERHVVIDHGIREVTRIVAADTKANVFRATHSRLVADINRFPDELDCVAPSADGTDIPMNRALDAAGRESRLARYFHPAIAGLKEFVRQVAARHGAEPLVVCMHSFARVLAEEPQNPKRQDICVFSYPEFGPIPTVDAFVRILRNQQPDRVIGHDEPFSARTPGLSTPPGDKRLASPTSFYAVIERQNVLNHFALEICQDLISDEVGQIRMAGAITKALRAAFDLSGSKPRLRDQPE
jgi:predicted N-formylglutamate amidohydrolase